MIQTGRLQVGPGFYSASNRNYQYQKMFLGVKRGRRMRLTTSPPCVWDSQYLSTLWASKACYGDISTFFFTRNIAICLRKNLKSVRQNYTLLRQNLLQPALGIHIALSDHGMPCVMQFSITILIYFFLFYNLNQQSEFTFYLYKLML
jgi:hypothetical protein